MKVWAPSEKPCIPPLFSPFSSFLCRPAVDLEERKDIDTTMSEEYVARHLLLLVELWNPPLFPMPSEELSLYPMQFKATRHHLQIIFQFWDPAPSPLPQIWYYLIDKLRDVSSKERDRGIPLYGCGMIVRKQLGARMTSAIILVGTDAEARLRGDNPLCLSRITHSFSIKYSKPKQQ